MAEVRLNPRIRSPREVSPSLICLAFLLLLSCRVPAAIWYCNDDKTEGDCITHSTGNDLSGDGSESRPYRSLKQVFSIAREGDTLKLDTGDYEIPLPEKAGTETTAGPLTLSRLTVEGTGPEKTRIHSNGKTGLAFANSHHLKLKEFSIVGGDTSLLLDHCVEASLLHIRTLDSANYGILVKESHQNKIEECQTSQSGFRGLQLRRSSNNTISKHLSSKNTNAGICLEGSSDNRLLQCRSDGNGLGGFYIYRKSNRNRLEKCSAESNRLSGFYLDQGSSENDLAGNSSTHNERGFTLSSAPDNFLVKNIAAFNETFGFWIKSQSSRGRLEDNQANSNGNSGFIFAPDSPPSLFGNNRSQNNRFPDSLVTVPDTVPPAMQAKN